MSELPAKEPRRRDRPLRRWLPLAAIVAGVGRGHRHGLEPQDFLRDAGSPPRGDPRIHPGQQGRRGRGLCRGLCGGVALSLPGALILTLSGGILFGGVVGGAAAIVGATAGAIHHLPDREERVRRASGAARRDRWPRSLRTVFAPMRSTISCFCGWCRCSRSSWSISFRRWPACGLRRSSPPPVIGIIPATFAFAFMGAGLDSVIRAQGAIYNACLAAGRADCRLDFDVKAAVTPELLARAGGARRHCAGPGRREADAGAAPRQFVRIDWIAAG